jgi:hypothetical protein
MTLLAYSMTCLAASRKLALAAAVPDWLTGAIGASWQQLHGARIDNLHLPASETARAKLAEQFRAGVEGVEGVEGAMRQATHGRYPHRRYIGRDKTRLEHAAAAAAGNLLRLDAWWTGRPLDRTRTIHLRWLDFSRAA